MNKEEKNRIKFREVMNIQIIQGFVDHYKGCDF